jgi:hypothetical protein
VKTNKPYWIAAAAIALMLVVTISLPATTINGVANQVISGFAQYAVMVAGGSGDLVPIPPSSTSGLPLISQGSSANPAFLALPNAGLANSSVTVNTSAPLSGGGAISLGGSITIACSTCLGPAGVTNATPGASPTWTIANGNISWTLSANATATVTVAAGDQWKIISAHVCQPSSGGPYTLAWPSNVHGGMTIGTTASKCSDQVFESPDGANLYATSTGVIAQ